MRVRPLITRYRFIPVVTCSFQEIASDNPSPPYFLPSLPADPLLSTLDFILNFRPFYVGVIFGADLSLLLSFSLFFYPFFRLLLFFSSVCVCRCFRFSLNFSLIIITDFFYYFLSGGYLGTLSLFPPRLPLLFALSVCVCGVFSFVVVWFALSRSLSLADKGVVQR